MTRRLRLGYACAWWHPREQTWSYTATRVREALDARAAVTDVEAQRSLAGKAVLSLLYSPFRRRAWQYSPVERALVDRAVRRAVRDVELDAVLGIADVDTPTPLPTFLYQDLNAAVGLAQHARVGMRNVNLPAAPSRLRSLGERQAERGRQATGVFAMSGWYRDALVRDLGYAAERVWVVYGGMNNPPTSYRPVDRPPEGRVLFVGTDFVRKGGDLVLEAVRRLRHAGDHPVQLTVVGPDRWPGGGDPPPWVTFHGPLPPLRVSALLAQHDVFAMPSRFEAFGIALAEALVAGLPCVARKDFAMPEIVEEGVTGELVTADDADMVASALTAILEDSDVYSRVAAARPELLHRHRWDTAAKTIVDQIENVLALP